VCPSAGMHDAGIARGVRKPGLLGDRRRIHVGTQADAALRRPARQRRNDPVPADAGLETVMLGIHAFLARSFRGDAKHRTRNLEIPGSPFGRPLMTVQVAKSRSFKASSATLAITRENCCFPADQASIDAPDWQPALCH
jgi:hypothetical protein